MQANWSLMLNIIFLSVILSMIVWRLRPLIEDKFLRKNKSFQHRQSMKEDLGDEIISVRRLDSTFDNDDVHDDSIIDHSSAVATEKKPELGLRDITNDDVEVKKNIMIFLAAQGQSNFAGYELLQSLLSCGLRYGVGGLFHRHQHASGQGPILFSLAAATATGTFDLQNMGALTVKGLCMFMECSGNMTIDHERYEIFVQTAKQLSDELQAILLDEKQNPVTLETYARFERMLVETVES